MNKEEINRIIEKGAEFYSENILLQTAITSLPGIGTYIDKLFSHTANKIQMSRILDFLIYLKEEMNKIDENKIDKSYVESEDFFDLLYISFDEVRKTRLREKHLIFAKILSNSTLNEENTENIEMYIRIIKELSIVDLKISNYLYNNKDKVNSLEINISQPIWNKMEQELSINNEDKKNSLSKLLFIGLIDEKSLGMLNGGKGDYGTTYLLDRIIKFISTSLIKE